MNKNLTMAGLGFTSGLPYMLIFSTLSIWLRDVGIDLTIIGFFAWISLTYSLKFLWSPLVDRYSIPFLKYFGSRKSWIILMQIFIVILTIILMGIFTYLITKTDLGRAQRACEQDRTMTALLGINVDRTISITFIIGSSLASVAGMMFVLYYGVIDFYIGFLAGIKAFTAAVLGGIGSLPGAMLGGLLIGLIETFWAGYVSLEYKDVAAFSVLIVVLIFFPTGFLGKPDIEKV